MSVCVFASVRAGRRSRRPRQVARRESGAPACRSPTSSTPASGPASQVWGGSGVRGIQTHSESCVLLLLLCSTLVANREKELLLHGLYTFQGFRL